MSDLYAFLEENRGEPQNIGIKYEHIIMFYISYDFCPCGSIG
jgi:hypothetical protein